MDEKHILVSLGDEKVKYIGEVIGNKTCNKILDLLSLEDLTVSDISKKLKIPLNTTDYNIKKLIKAGLIEKSSHFWSVKGKKMPTYKVSNRKIIISPKQIKTKNFAWVFGLTTLAALAIREFTKKTSEILYGQDLAMEIANTPMRAASPEVESVAMGTGMTNEIIETTANPSFWQNMSPWTWFLIGAWFTILIFFALTIFNERRNKK